MSNGTITGAADAIAIQMTFHLTLDFAAVSSTFNHTFAADIASSMTPSLPVDRVRIQSIRAGSILVDFILLPGPGLIPSSAALQLLTQYDLAGRSLLVNGIFTQYIDFSTPVVFTQVATYACSDGTWKPECAPITTVSTPATQGSSDALYIYNNVFVSIAAAAVGLVLLVAIAWWLQKQCADPRRYERANKV
jgi:hypothetical protein